MSVNSNPIVLWNRVDDLLEANDFITAESVLINAKNTILTPREKSLWAYLYARSLAGNGQYEKALLSLDEARTYLKETIDQLLDYQISIQKSICYCHQGVVNKAQQILEEVYKDLNKGIDTHESKENKTLKGLTLNWLGNVYWLGGDLPKALDQYIKALSLHEYLGDKDATAMSLNNIGLVYRTQGRLTKALDVFKRIMELQLYVKNPKTIASCYMNMGQIYLDKNRFEEAEKKFLQALTIRESFNNQLDIADSIFNVIRVYLEMNKLTPNMPLLQKFPIPPFQSVVIEALEHMVQALIAKSQKDWNVMEQRLQKALDITGLDFGYQIYCIEGLTEVGLYKWQTNKPDLLVLTDVYAKLDRLKILSLKNNLVASLSKAFLLQAKLSTALHHFDEATGMLTECLNIANRHDLELIKAVSLRELHNIRKKKEAISDDPNIFLQAPTVDELEIEELQKLLRSLE